MVSSLGLNKTFAIKNANGTSFHNLVLRKSAYDSVVMALNDKITGDVYYKDNKLAVTMQEYIEFDGVKFVLVNPPTIVREGLVSENGSLNGMTKYSFVFYHPMYLLSNFPFADVAVTSDQQRYLSESKTFSWIGYPDDFIAKLNKNLEGTQWMVVKSDRFPQDIDDQLSQVMQFDDITVAEALKKGYEEWGVPYVVDKVVSGETGYSSGKRFKVIFGLPSNEIYENSSQQQLDNPYIFQMGKGVGLKNNSRTPRNNKIITRIAGYGSEDNIPYGYPQIVWTGNQEWKYTIDNDSTNPLSYPIYDGIVGGQNVKLIKHPFTRTHLMPSIFSELVNLKVNPLATGYDPTIELKDYYDAISDQTHQYPNEIIANAPSYEIHEFEDIKPELDSSRTLAITGCVPLNADLTPASSWDDTMDEEGNYVQSFFQMTLPALGFDIYACAAITQEMQINMRGGACLGCTFDVQVDWDDYKLNFYDSEGNFAPTGSQRDYTKYPDSTSQSINIILKKENSTFGTLMPNRYQYPQSGDIFVVLGISLPLTYITNAEQRLDEEMKSYMLENNVHYWDYPLKFDEKFLADNTYILGQLKPNSIVHFKFGDENLELFVKQLTIKYGEKPLPQYDITLTDNIEAVINQIGQVADDVEKLSSLISILRQNYSRNVWTELAKKLSKTQDDTAQGFIKFIKGLQVGNTFDANAIGAGGVFREEPSDPSNPSSPTLSNIVADKIYIRLKAYFDTVEIRKFLHSGGNRIASVAGAKCIRVEGLDASNNVVTTGIVKYRCYFRGKDDEDTVTNDFEVGDLAYCHVTNVSSGTLNQHSYWRLVVGKSTSVNDDNEHYIDLSNTTSNVTITVDVGGTQQTYTHAGMLSGSDTPLAQDDIIQLGNIYDVDRQGAIIEYVSGTDAPSYKIYQHINDYTLDEKVQIGIYYNSGTGRAKMDVYGDMYIGAKPASGQTEGSTYIHYMQDDGTSQHQPLLKIKAKVEMTSSQSTIDGTPISQYQFYDDAEVWQELADLQDQIDGELDTWYYEGVPTLNNLPASQWTTDSLKKDHVGDLYYDKNTGYAYRFVYDNENEVYKWDRIHDDAISEALRIANDAQDTADHKRRIFTVQPTPPYDAGDLWVNATYPANTTATDASQNKYCNEILRCKVAKPTRNAQGTVTNGNFAITDWQLANESLNSFINGTYATFVTNIQNQVDQKAETWYQNTDPSSAWYDDTQTPVYDVRSEHIGDIWHNTSSSTVGGVESNRDAIWNGTAWVMSDVPQSVYDTIDGKADIFVTRPTTYNKNDMWIINISDTSTYMPDGCKKGDIVIAAGTNMPAKRTNNYQKADWVKKDRYTDDTYAKQFDYLATVLPDSSTVVDGGLVLTTLIGMRGTETTPLIWAGLSGMYQSSDTGTIASTYKYKGHGTASWYGGDMHDFECLTTSEKSSLRYAKSLFRFDGSGYLAGGNITWDANGLVTIQNIHTLTGDDNTNILNEMAAFHSMFDLSLYASLSQIHPNQSFDHIYISHANNYVLGNNDVLTYGELKDKFVTVEFFEKMFELHSGASGNPKVSTNATLPSDMSAYNIKAMVGLWTEKYLSALGLNSNSGGGGGSTTLYGLLDVKPNSADTMVYGLDGTSSDNGKVLTYSTTYNKWIAAPTAETYTLPAATSGALGGIKIGYSASGTNYAVQLDSSSNAYVTVPSYSLPTASSSTKGGIKVGTTLAISSAVLDLASVTLGTPVSGDTTYTKVVVDSYGRISKATTLAAADIPDISSTYATSGRVSTLEGYFTNGVANEAAKLSTTSKTAWGQTYWTSEGVPTNISGDISNTGNVTPSATASKNIGSSTRMYEYGYIRRLNTQSGYDLRIGAGGTQYIQINNSTGATTLSSSLSVASGITLTTTKKIYFGDTSHYIELDSNGYFHFSHGLYSDSFVSALGLNSSGGGGGGGGAGDVTWDALASTNADPTHRWIDISYLTGALATYATQSWVGNNYLPLSGGTMTGSIVMGANHYIYGVDETKGALIYFDGSRTVVGSCGTSSTAATLLRSSTSHLLVSNGGSSVYTVWDSGNDGASSGLDADLLDGYHASSFPLIRNINDSSGDDFADVLKGYSGTFFFYGNNLKGGQYDWVGLQIGSSADKGQIIFEDGSISVRQNDNGGTSTTGWTDWGKLAFTTSNVASATKLQTSRNIWGQSFDGTANVSGNLYMIDPNAADLNRASGKIKFISKTTSDTDGQRAPYIQAIPGYSGYGRKRLGFFTSNATNYTDAFVEALSIVPTGSVGIGTISPKTLLDVNGGVKGTKFYLYKPNADNDTNAIYFELDSNNHVHLVNAGFYSDSFVSALGLNSSGGGGGASMDVVWSALANSTNEQINVSHLTDALASYSTTDTKNTAGATNTSSKIYLIGATSQAANPQTYSHDTAYVGTDGCLYSGGTKVLTSHQSLSNYVTLDGTQTITGKKIFSGTTADLLTVDRNSTSAAWVRFMKDGTISGYIGVTPTHVAQFNNGTSTYTIWHSGNDGASSGLDADLLDGQHGSYYAKESYFYTDGVAKTARQLPYGYGHDGGAGITNPYHLIAEAALTTTSARTLSAVFLVSSYYNDSRGILIVQGRVDSGQSTINTSNTGARWIVRSSSLNVNNFIFTTKVTSNSLTCRLYYKVTATWKHARIRLLDDSTWASPATNWNLYTSSSNTAGDYVFNTIPSDETQFISVDDTSSASLATSRKLWGQDFNGSANVSGDMSSVGDISFSASGKNIGSLLYFDTTNSRIGVSTSSPSYALDVSGTFNVSTNATIGNTLTVTGATTLSSATLSSTLSVASTSTLTGNVTLGGYLYMPYNKSFYIKDSGGTSRSAMYVVASNSVELLRIGYGYRAQASSTNIYGGTSGINLYTNGTTARMYIDSSGNCTFYQNIYGENGKYIYFKDSGGTNRHSIGIDASNNYVIGYGVAGAGYNTYIYGNSVYLKYGTTRSDGLVVHANGYVRAFVGFYSDSYVSALGQNTSSDERKKDVMCNAVLSVDDIAKAPSVKYMWKSNKSLGLQAGSIAQYWQNVLPECVHEDTDGYLSMEYGVIALLASIATAKKVRDHEKRILELEKENERLRTEVEQLKA